MDRGHRGDAKTVGDPSVHDLHAIAVCMHYVRTDSPADINDGGPLPEIRPGRQTQRNDVDASLNERPQERMVPDPAREHRGHAHSVAGPALPRRERVNHTLRTTYRRRRDEVEHADRVSTGQRIGRSDLTGPQATGHSSSLRSVTGCIESMHTLNKLRAPETNPRSQER
jgi:hypothetical protein